MFKMLLRAGAALSIAALAVISAAGTGGVSAQGAAGTSPETAEDLGVRDITKVAVLQRGETHWFRAAPGFETELFGITLQINPHILTGRGEDFLLLRGPDRSNVEPGPIAAFVNFRGSSERLGGQQNKDAEGYTRVGFLTFTQNSGPDRAFWATQALPGESQTAFVKLVNNSGMDVTYALSVEHNPCRLDNCTSQRAMDPKTWGPLPPPWALAGDAS